MRTPVKLDVPVISVGNITTGGTGKTPMVCWLSDQCDHLLRGPERPGRPDGYPEPFSGSCIGIINRGYRAGPEGSDELRLIQHRTTNTLCISNPDRIAAGRALIHQGAGVLILDDAFQHRRIHRDLDIVLVDAMSPDGFGNVLPRGLLREPLSGLSRADVVIITRVSHAQADVVDRLRTKWAPWLGDAPLLACDHRPECFELWKDGIRVETDAITAKTTLAFCGIGNPRGFLATLGRLGNKPAAFVPFTDHHAYTTADCEALVQRAREVDAEFLLTTEKDMVKLKNLKHPWPIPLMALQITIDFVGEGGNMLLNLVEARLKEAVAHDAPTSIPTNRR
jgi:tetraacyldisaccharide 4'-kinase